MEKLARWCFRHRRIVLISWIVLVVFLGGLSSALKPTYKDVFKLPNTESKKAIDLLQAEFPAESGEEFRIVVHTKSGTVEDPDNKAKIEEMLAKVAKVSHVGARTGLASMTTPFSSARATMRSATRPRPLATTRGASLEPFS